jgi:membrane associated rhomboid family serine protease
VNRPLPTALPAAQVAAGAASRSCGFEKQARTWPAGSVNFAWITGLRAGSRLFRGTAMLFFPYRLDANTRRWPALTLLVCLLCAFVYWQQYSVDRRYVLALENFCVEQLSKREHAWLNRVPTEYRGNNCVFLLESIRESGDAQAEIERLAGLTRPINLFASKQDNLDHVRKQLSDIYLKYERTVPEPLTRDLVYDPGDLDLVKMFTATISHGNLMHLAGNLLFFYVFAAAIEIVFGGVVFVAFLLLTTIGTSLAYSYAMSGVENALPTLGLSGVVMAAVAALGIMMPGVRIRCFFWFFVIFRIIRIPALLLAAWFVGWDIYEMNRIGNDSYVNYVAHVSGAAIGAAFGIWYLYFRRDLLEAMRPEEA